MRRITSRSPIYDETGTSCVAGENVRKTAMFVTFSSAVKRALVVSQIREREVIFRVEMQLFRILHHFGLPQISKYSMAMEVFKILVGYGNFCQGTAVNSKNKVRYSKVVKTFISIR